MSGGMVGMGVGMNSGVEAFKVAWLKRRAQFSTVAFLRSSDPKRLPQFIKFIHDIYSSSSSRKPFRIFVYRVWSGLYEAKVVPLPDGTYTIQYEPVAPPTSSAATPLMQALSRVASRQQIRDLATALSFLDTLMNTSERVIAIFWGLFAFKNVSDNELYQFIKFLRNAIFTDRYYVKYHFIVVFTDFPEALADDDTLKHSISQFSFH